MGMQGLDTDFATLIRTLGITLVLAPFVWFTGKWINPFTLPPHALLFLGLSALATGASWLCYFRAFQLGDASKLAPVDKLSLVLVAVFAGFFLGERLNSPECLGFALVVIGGGTGNETLIARGSDSSMWLLQR